MGKYVVAVVSVAALAAAGSAWGAPQNSPGAIRIKVGHTRAFTAAELRPGRTVRCANDGHTLSVTVPVSSPATSIGTVWTQAGTRHFHLYVDARKGGGYQVGCALGGIHWATAGTRQQHHSTPRQAANSFLVI